MPADSELDVWNVSAKAQLRKVLVNKSWEEKLEASVRMRERDRELRASRSSASSSGATTAPNAPRTEPPPASPSGWAAVAAGSEVQLITQTGNHFRPIDDRVRQKHVHQRPVLISQGFPSSRRGEAGSGPRENISRAPDPADLTLGSAVGPAPRSMKPGAGSLTLLGPYRLLLAIAAAASVALAERRYRQSAARLAGHQVPPVLLTAPLDP